MSKKQLIQFNATKTIKKPTEVKFKTKEGKLISFSAQKVVKEKQLINFKARKK